MKRLDEIDVRHRLHDPALPVRDGPADRPRDFKSWARRDIALLSRIVRIVAESPCCNDEEPNGCGGMFERDRSWWCWPCRVRRELEGAE